MMYKYSQYNHFTKYNSQYIAFNFLSGALICISEKALSWIKKNDCSELEKLSKDLFDILIKGRFIISKDINEIDYIRFRSKKQIFLERNYHLMIQPTLECNFRCGYCVQSHKKGRMTQEIQERIIKHIDDLIEKRKITGVDLSWFGGEPTLLLEEVVYPLSLKIKERCVEHNLHFSNFITTNGYLATKNALDKYKDIDIKRFQITLDGNKDQHNNSRKLENGEGTFDTIIENIISILENIEEAFIYLRINYIDKTLSNLNSIYESIPEKYRKQVQINFQRVWQTHKKEFQLSQVLKKQLNIAREMGYSTSGSHFSLYKGVSCYVERWNYLSINYDGKVFKCTQHDFEDKDSYGKLSENGSVDWDINKLTKHYANTTFENDMCLNCKFLPLCLGPCIKNILNNKEENTKHLCRLNQMEITIDDFVIEKYLGSLKSQTQEERNTLYEKKLESVF